MKKKYANQMTVNVAGTTFEGRQGKLCSLKKMADNAYLTLRREKSNAFDPNAVAVIAVLPNGTHMKIGYVPRDHNKAVAACLDAGTGARVRNFAVVGGGDRCNYGCKMTMAF